MTNEIDELKEHNRQLQNKLQALEASQQQLVTRLGNMIEQVEVQAFENARGKGTMSTGPSPADLREFADLKIAVTPFEEIIRFDAERKGINIDDDEVWRAYIGKEPLALHRLAK